MRIRLPFPDCEHRIVSFAKDGFTAADLAENSLSFILIENGKATLFPEHMSVTVSEEDHKKLDACDNYDVFELFPDGTLLQVCDCDSPESVFYVTGTCNSNCIMCPSPASSRINCPKPDIDLLIEIAKHMPSDLPHITVTGGEPFMAGKDIFRLFEYCKDKFERTEFQILTNGRIFAVEDYCDLLWETVPYHSNMRCIYCQANNGVQQPNVFMTKEIAEKSVDIALQSPAKYLSFEFQGGEPLLNFDVIKHIVLYTEDHKADHEIEYNLVSNLTLLTDEMLDFLQNNNVHISTSIDGQRALHDCNRPFPDGRGTFDSVRDAINRLRNRGIRTGAIQTTTKQSLSHAKNIVDAYISLGFDGVFVRPLTPLGKALRSWDSIGYEPGDFVAFYSELLRAVLDANRKGYYIREEHAAMLMRKIGGCSVNYMELRSPCGAGIGQLAYFADGNVFTCDEGRMLFEMGNDSFYLGNVFNDRYADLIGNSTCKAVCASSVLETIPSCCDCVYQPYCGTCPVVSFALRNDIIEKQPRDYKCLIYMGIFDTVFALLQEGDPETVKILESWGN